MPYDTEERLSAALHDIVGDRPFTPDIDQIEDRGRQLRHRRVAWRATAGGAFAVAAVAAVAVAVSGSGSAPAPARNVAGPSPAAPSATPTVAVAPLPKLVAYLTTAKLPAGDATLIVRDQKYQSGLHVVVYDLYGDNGKTYYFAKKRSGLPAQVRGHHTQGDGLFAREVAAAKYAATGDLAEARRRMASAPSPKTPVDPIGPGVVPAAPNSKKLPAGLKDQFQVNRTDNWVWEDSQDALIAGAGNPTVRAGVLRLLSTLPEVKVTSGTVAGQPTLTLTAGKPALPGSYTESLTINASTGIPVKFAAGGGDVVVNYTVTRVSLADVAQGTF